MHVRTLLQAVRRRLRNQKAPPSVPKVAEERSFIEETHTCPACRRHVEVEELKRNLYVCPGCEHHFQITPYERIAYLLDEDTFEETGRGLISSNPLNFPEYQEKLAKARTTTHLNEAVVTGTGRIRGHRVVLGAMSFHFMGGSMGSVVGEKITRAIMLGAEERLPVIIFTASGGARMQEGIFSLMQMAKTADAVARLESRGMPLFIVLTDPTTGGVTASFAMLGNVILAEPNAMIGFAGKRVVEGANQQRLPENFQCAEFQLEKGFVDAIVPRKSQCNTLALLLASHATTVER